MVAMPPLLMATDNVSGHGKSHQEKTHQERMRSFSSLEPEALRG
jgi:hypothetical protein